MSLEVAISFSRMEGLRAARTERMLSLVPTLAEGALISSDLAVRATAMALLGVLRFDTDATTRALERVRFWCTRAGGSWAPLAMMDPEYALSFLRRLEACEAKRRDVAPPSLPAALRELLAPLDAPVPSGPGWPPVLVVDVNGPGWDAFEYDPSASRFFIPGALSPVIGDVLLLELRTPEPIACRAHVVAVRPLSHASPGRPCGFEVALAPEARRIRAELAARCPLRSELPSGRRSSPRFHVAASASVTSTAGERRTITGTVANLSQGGAYVTSDAGQAPFSVGTPLELELTMPDGAELVAAGTVVHATESGIGIRFERDPGSQARLAEVLAQLPGRPRRVLVIDDDALARRVLADAFEEAGFDVLTAPDALSGLQTLTEEMLSLDLLVTDVVMREIDGVELLRRVRHDGNEADLPIVAITASVTAELKEHLLRAGADAVAVKSIGPRLIVRTAEDVLARGAEKRRSDLVRRRSGTE